MFQAPAANAATGGYPHWGAYAYDASSYDWRVDENGDGDYTDGAPLYEWCSQRMYWYRNCTDYVAWKLESLGVSTSLTRDNGNGANWDNARPSLITSNPEPGDVAVWDGGYGHVAFIEVVHSDGTITISEYNGAGDGNYRTQRDTPSALGSGIDHYLDFGVQSNSSRGQNDFDGDGNSDIFLYGPGSTASDAVLYGMSSGDYFDAESINVTAVYDYVIPGDFDDDGYDDVYLYDQGTGGDMIMRGESTQGSFDVVTPQQIGGTYIPALEVGN